MGGFTFLRKILQILFSIPFPLSHKILGKLFPAEIENIEKMVSLVSRTGRHLQRYDSKGCRLVVGCIPYRYRKIEKSSSIDGTLSEELEVLMISSQRGKEMLFPKGGWEIDESMEAAALRETQEEAGVIGNVECKLGEWCYKSKSHGTLRVGHIFPLLVKNQLEFWPEKSIRQRRWMSVAEAEEVCPHWWMKKALDVLVDRQQKEETPCTR